MPKINKKTHDNLIMMHPQIALQWHPDLNGELTPENVKAGSSKKAWWKCEKGHEWQASICHRTINQSNCPYCSGRCAIKGENDLQTLMPAIAKEWHPLKNKELLPTDVKTGSNKKVWWLCPEGHEWQATIYDRTRKKGSGCPYCSGNLNIQGKTDLQTLFPCIAKEFDNDKNENISSSDLFAKSGKKVWWKCKKGHCWRTSVISRTNLKSGCPYCRGKRPIFGENDLATLFPTLVSEWNWEKNKHIAPSDCTVSSGRKVWWICKEGHEWQGVISTRTGNEKCGCPYCSGRYAITGVNDLKTLRPDIAIQWDCQKNKSLSCREVTPYSNKKVWWICKEGHEWKTAISQRTRKHNPSGCPYCSGLLAIQGKTDLATLRPDLIQEWHPTKNGKVKINELTLHSGKKVWWICNNGHEWRTSVIIRSRGSNCPYCGK